MKHSEDFYNQEYNPRLSVVNHLDIMQGWQTKSELARASSQCLLDVAYGPDQDEKLDLFLASQKGAPCLLFIHGGYWRASDKSEFSFIAKAFVQAGANVFVINYGLAPRLQLEEIVLQIQRATEWVRDHATQYDADATKIYMTGHSAGGHLASMMTTIEPDSPRPMIQGVLSISGLYDLTPLVSASFLNTVLKLDITRAQALSPVLKKSNPKIPFWTCVGGDESSEFHRQNQMIAQAWPDNFQADIPMPGHNHFDLMDALAQPSSEIHKAIVRMIRL
jgi:arylformamidase